MSEEKLLNEEELEQVNGGLDRPAGDEGYSNPISKYDLEVGKNYYFVYWNDRIHKYTYYSYGTLLWTGETPNPLFPDNKKYSVRFHKFKALMGIHTICDSQEITVNGDNCTVYLNGPKYIK